MPDTGYYEERPRPESVRTFLQYLSSNKKVVHSITKISDQVYAIKRIKKSDVIVYLTNLYIVGIADLHSFRSAHPNISAIVTMSAWNGYSAEAKDTGAQLGIGVFTFKEFLGAIFYDGQKFLDYVPPVKNKD